jgi:hypothetical protein
MSPNIAVTRLLSFGIGDWPNASARSKCSADTAGRLLQYLLSFCALATSTFEFISIALRFSPFLLRFRQTEVS